MAENDPNPYESPQSIAAAPSNRPITPIAATVIRITTMGLIGFASFSAVGFLYFWLAEHFQLEIFPSPAWALGVGGVGAAIFLGAELLNYGAGRITRFFNRTIVASVFFVVSAFIGLILIDSLGWNPQTYDSDPWWLHRLVLLAVIYYATLVGLRILGDWIAMRH